MDPNENLKEQLKLANDIVNTDLEGDDLDPMRLAELVLAMDQWMRAGGFPPDDWKKSSQETTS